MIYRQALLPAIEKHKPEVLVLSMNLPGDEDLRSIVFESQRLGSRIILLTGDTTVTLKDEQVMEMFYLGVRDFIRDPIKPNILLESISRPATYAEATQQIKRLPPPVKPNSKLSTWFNQKLERSTAPVDQALSLPVQQRLRGILALLNATPTLILEQDLSSIEKRVAALVGEAFRLNERLKSDSGESAGP